MFRELIVGSHAKFLFARVIKFLTLKPIWINESIHIEELLPKTM